MALFDYVGQLRSGAAFQGTLEADSPAQAETLLADMGVRVSSLRPARRTGYVAPLSLDDVLFFNEQLAALTKAGAPLEEGLRRLAGDTGSGKLKRLLTALADELNAGRSLAEAIERHRGRFPEQYADVVRAGVATGDLSGALYGVSAHLRLTSNFRRALVELAIYPLTILTIALLILSFLMRVVVPQIELLFEEYLRDPKLSSSFAGGWRTSPRQVGWSGVVFDLARQWPLIEGVAIGLLGGVCLLFLLTWLPGGRPVREWLLRRIPGVAQVYWSSVLARFTHTTALGAFTGTPLPELLRAGGAASGSLALAGAADRAAGKLTAGQPLQAVADSEPAIPGLWACVVRAAGPRGELAATLAELARNYESRAEHWARITRTVLGPILLFVVASILGGVLLALGLAFAHMLRAITG